MKPKPLSHSFEKSKQPRVKLTPQDRSFVRLAAEILQQSEDSIEETLVKQRKKPSVVSAA
ncbi:MAG: hypothetical protein HKN23_16065 [Verrucomicrobiales bacterium]|nr:hypothetical protein [Verrucomicrobiales bacterium]